MTATMMQSEGKSSKRRAKTLVISYLRFSTPEQAQGDSVRRQLDKSRRWAEQRGLTIDESIDDRGVSAFRGTNATEGKLASFLRLCQLGRIPRGSVLLVESLDRLTRQHIRAALKLFLDIIDAGIKIVTLSDGQEYSDERCDEKELIVSLIVMSRAHEESKMKSQRIGEAWSSKRAKIGEGAILTRQMPAWLKINSDGKIVVDEPKAKIVRRIFKLAADGGGLSAITRTLNKECEGIGRADFFHRSYVCKILHSRAVIGEFQPCTKRAGADGKRRREVAGEVVKGYFPAVISEADFFAAQQQLTSRKTMRGPSSKWVNLFVGLLYNVEDGASLVAVDKGCGRRYVSADWLNGKKGATTTPVFFPIKLFEDALLLRLAKPELYATNDDQLATAQRDLAAAEGELDAVESKSQQIQDALLTGRGASSASVVGLLNKLDARRAELADTVAELRGRLTTAGHGRNGTVADLLGLLAKHREGGLSNDQRHELRAALRKLIERIDCHFIRDGKADYAAGTMVTLRNGSQFDFSFRGEWINDTPRNAKGHLVARKAKDAGPKWKLVIPMEQGTHGVEHPHRDEPERRQKNSRNAQREPRR